MKSVTKPIPDAVRCPFCQSSDIHNWSSDDHEPGKPSWSVMCFDCEAEGPHCSTEAEAIARWNTRHTIPAAPSDPEADRRAVIDGFASLRVCRNEALPVPSATGLLKGILALPPTIKAALRRLLEAKP